MQARNCLADPERLSTDEMKQTDASYLGFPVYCVRLLINKEPAATTPVKLWRLGIRQTVDDENAARKTCFWTPYGDVTFPARPELMDARRQWLK
jgi:hypothetical protein